MLAGLFSPVLKWIQKKRCLIDNSTFRLHYQITFVILVAASILVNAKQFFGDPIKCITDNDKVKAVFDTYCW